MIATLPRRLAPLVHRTVSEPWFASRSVEATGKPVLSEVLSQSRLPALDGLRAIGVVAVIIGHSSNIKRLPSDFGPTAFFVLSGFLITRLLLRGSRMEGGVSIGRFYLGRTLRIFPAYFAFLLVSYLWDAHVGKRWSSALLGSAVTYTVNYFNAIHHHPTTSLAHTWSLGVEEQFYLLWPLFFVILLSRGRPVLIGATALAASFGIAWRSWLILGGHADNAYVYNAFETRFDNLAVGCLLALTIDNKAILAVAERCAKRAWFSMVTLALLLTSRLLVPNGYHFTLGFTIDSLLVAILIVQLLQLYRTRLWAWLEWPAVRYIGAISYPMYLYHAWGASVGRRLMPGHFLPAEILAGMLATIVLASASYFLLERPMLKLKPRSSDNAPVHTPPAITDVAQQPAVALASPA